MTAVTKTPIAILASVTVAAGGTKAAPAAGGTGGWIDVTAYNGGLLGGRIKNNGTLGAPGQMTWQWTPDPNANPVKIYDLWTWGGELASGVEWTASTRLDKEVKHVRAIFYGNTTSSVTYESDLAAGS